MNRSHPFESVLKERRSIRHFTKRVIGDAEIQDILDDAVWAPSPGNAQSWQLVVLSEDKSSQVLENFEDRGWSYIYPLLKGVVRRQYGDADDLVAKTKEFYGRYLKATGKPRLIFVCGKKSSLREQLMLSSKVLFNGVSPFFDMALGLNDTLKVHSNLTKAGLANLAYAITLCAHDRGLATCIQAAYCNLSEEIVTYLGIDPTLEIFLSILIGEEDPKRPLTPQVLLDRDEIRTHWIK